MATTEQLDMLRAMVSADFDRHEEISHRLHAAGELEGYGSVIGAAFYLAVRKQFPSGHSSAEVIRLAADVRAIFDKTGDEIDPRAVELMIRSALGEADLASEVPDATVIQIQMITVSALAGEDKLGDPNEFMDLVQKLLDRWGA